MLFNGEEVGDGTGAACDVAVDPIDGTRLCANGMPNAVSVLAVAARGSMYDRSAVFYMSKLATGPEAAGMVDVSAPPEAHIAVVPGPRPPTARRDRCDPGPAPARGADPPGPGGWRADQADHRR